MFTGVDVIAGAAGDTIRVQLWVVNPPLFVARNVTGWEPTAGEDQLTSPVVLPTVMPGGAASSDHVTATELVAVAG